jgi:hypothetical protein
MPILRYPAPYFCVVHCAPVSSAKNFWQKSLMKLTLDSLHLLGPFKPCFLFFRCLSFELCLSSHVLLNSFLSNLLCECKVQNKFSNIAFRAKSLDYFFELSPILLSLFFSNFAFRAKSLDYFFELSPILLSLFFSNFAFRSGSLI